MDHNSHTGNKQPPSEYFGRSKPRANFLSFLGERRLGPDFKPDCPFRKRVHSQMELFPEV